MKVYEIITNLILEKLDQGFIPWRRPWSSPEGMPRNLITGKEYQGINAFILACQHYGSPYWLTFKQCKDLRGSVKKGSRGTPVVYWNWIEVKEEDDLDKRVPFLRYYTVFNITQCEDIPIGRMPATPETADNHIDRIAECEAIVENWNDKPEIRHGEQRAYYSPATDLVNMPQLDTFISSEEYYSTLFHELTHSTGLESRLNRQGITEIAPFGAPLYSKEELIAEMGAAFLCGFTGIEHATIDSSAAYIQGWLKKLRNDKKLIIIAAAQAQKAAKYILGVSP